MYESGVREDGGSCIVVAKGWPSWAFALEATGIHIRTIILVDQEWWGFVQTCFSRAEVLMLAKLVEGYMLPQVSCAFADIDVVGWLGFWSTVSDYIVSMHPERWKPPPWSVQVLMLNHVGCGRATMGEWKVNVYVPQLKEQGHVQLAPVSQQDLRGVLSATCGRGLSCPPPKVTQFEVPAAIEVHLNVFHGGGLMPYHNCHALHHSRCIQSNKVGKATPGCRHDAGHLGCAGQGS